MARGARTGLGEDRCERGLADPERITSLVARIIGERDYDDGCNPGKPWSEMDDLTSRTRSITGVRFRKSPAASISP
jgi:hypothetical protein